MDAANNDKRFAHIPKDPRFRRVPVTTKKVTIDKRFDAMFKDKKFQLKYTVDKRGRPVNVSSTEQLKDFYRLDSDESDEDEKESEKQRRDKPEEDADAESERDTDKEPEGDDEEESEDETDVEKSNKAVGDKKLEKKKTLLQPKLKKVNGFIVTEITPKEEEPKVEIDDAVRAKLHDLEVDYIRGEGVLYSDSSSDEDFTDDEAEEELVHDWGELDKDAEETDTATSRLAICHMDWDRIRAVDLMVVLNSFAPQGGRVKCVTIYPSEFGLQRLKEEEVMGPKELVELKGKETELGEGKVDDNEEGNDYHREKLRQYQLNRLKYYYAVAACDSAATAGTIYKECDGQEFESSAAKIDLRFIPEDMTFDQEPHDVCNALPDPSMYEPRQFLTSALQQAKVHLTWDETDPSRMQTMQKLFQNKPGQSKKKQVDDETIKGLLATSSEEEDDDGHNDDHGNGIADSDDDIRSNMGESERIAKYRQLMASIAKKEEESKKGKTDVEMEITWDVGLKDRAEKLVKKKLVEKSEETTWEKQLAKSREKHKAKRLEKKKQLEVAPPSDEEDDDNEPDEVPSDIDMNDSYFREEFENGEFEKPKKNKKKSAKGKDVTADVESEEDDEKKKAQLELLLMDEHDNRKHFDYKSIVKEETGKKDKKKSGEPSKQRDDSFKVILDDPRFSALYTSHHFNLDPSDPSFKKTEAMEAILQEKQRRRANTETVPGDKQEEPKAKQFKGDTELSRLVRSVKGKAASQKNCNSLSKRQIYQRSVVKVSEKRPNREKYAERDMLSNDGTRQDTKTRRKTIQKR
uniref:EOG090X0289 n=1 Tax=Moina brachiata TaxID=675436 RepID=A0A4Y7NJ12_9CRUS|nr:EOG090X0289 [Moina brachiata]